MRMIRIGIRALKALPETAINEADRFDFNEEQISITVAPALVTLKIKGMVFSL